MNELNGKVIKGVRVVDQGSCLCIDFTDGSTAAVFHCIARDNIVVNLEGLEIIDGGESWKQ